MRKLTASLIVVFLAASAGGTQAQEITITHDAYRKMIFVNETPKGTNVQIVVRFRANGLITSIDSLNEKYLAANGKYVTISQRDGEIDATRQDQNSPDFQATLKIRWSGTSIDYEIVYSKPFSQAGHLSLQPYAKLLADANFSFEIHAHSIKIHRVLYNGYADLVYDGKTTHYYYKGYDNFSHTYEWNKQSVIITSLSNMPGAGWISDFPKVRVDIDKLTTPDSRTAVINYLILNFYDSFYAEMLCPIITVPAPN